MKRVFYIISTYLFIISNCYAFRLITNTGAAFSTDKVSVSATSNSTCTNAGISSTEILKIVDDAIDMYWNKVATSSLKLTNAGLYQTTNSQYLTGELCASDSTKSCDVNTTVPTATDIIIACNSNITNFPSSSYLAISAPNNVSNSSITGAVILINDSSNSSFSTLAYNEKVSVLAHEIGHAIGLGHSNKNYALMYYKNSDSQLRLSQDDIDGVSYLYPNTISQSCSGMFGGTINFIGKKNSFIDKPFFASLLLGVSIGFLILILAKFFTHIRIVLDRRIEFQ